MPVFKSSACKCVVCITKTQLPVSKGHFRRPSCISKWLLPETKVCVIPCQNWSDELTFDYNGSFPSSTLQFRVASISFFSTQGLVLNLSCEDTLFLKRNRWVLLIYTKGFYTTPRLETEKRGLENLYCKQVQFWNNRTNVWIVDENCQISVCGTMALTTRAKQKKLHA